MALSFTLETRFLQFDALFSVRAPMLQHHHLNQLDGSDYEAIVWVFPYDRMATHTPTPPHPHPTPHPTPPHTPHPHTLGVC